MSIRSRPSLDGLRVASALAEAVALTEAPCANKLRVRSTGYIDAALVGTLRTVSPVMWSFDEEWVHAP